MHGWCCCLLAVCLAPGVAVATDCVPPIDPATDVLLPPCNDAMTVELARLRGRLDRDLGVPDHPLELGHVLINEEPDSGSVSDTGPAFGVDDGSVDSLNRARRLYVSAYLQARWPQHPDWLDEALGEYYGSGNDEPLTADSYQRLRVRHQRARRPRWQYMHQLDVMPSILSREYADAFIRLRPDWSR